MTAQIVNDSLFQRKMTSEGMQNDVQRQQMTVEESVEGGGRLPRTGRRSFITLLVASEVAPLRICMLCRISNISTESTAILYDAFDSFTTSSICVFCYPTLRMQHSHRWFILLDSFTNPFNKQIQNKFDTNKKFEKSIKDSVQKIDDISSNEWCIESFAYIYIYYEVIILVSRSSDDFRFQKNAK